MRTSWLLIILSIFGWIVSINLKDATIVAQINQSSEDSLFLLLLLTSSSFFLSHPEDRLPPSVVVNKGLVLDENSAKKLTTLQLSASDQDSEPSELIYRINKQPSLGHLEHAASPGNNTRAGFEDFKVKIMCHITTLLLNKALIQKRKQVLPEETILLFKFKLLWMDSQK